MLSKDQRKGVNTGVSFWAIGQLLIALGILVLWLRSIGNSFDRAKSAKPIPTLSGSSFSGEIPLYNLTPTMTPWTVLEPSNPTPTPKSTPVPENTPEIAPEVIFGYSSVTPTPTPWFTNMYIPPVPGFENKPTNFPTVLDPVEISARISYYYPPLAYLPDPKWRINCDEINGVLECEQMASGYFVVDWMGHALACPGEFPYGTVFEVWGRYYVCLDRGGAIVRNDDGSIWLDLLYSSMPEGHYWSEQTQVRYWLPGS